MDVRCSEGDRDGDLFISPDGHYRGPEGVEKKLLCVVQTDSGQETLAPEEFSKRHGWKNDPAKATLPLEANQQQPAATVDRPGSANATKPAAPTRSP
jgi:hypothetical protein